MLLRFRLLRLFLASAVLGLSQAPLAADPPANWVTVYNSNRANFADWKTSVPEQFFWDPAVQAFHYVAVSGLFDYAWRQVPYHGGSFRLQFDWLSVRTEPLSYRVIGLADFSLTVAIAGNYVSGPWGFLLDALPSEGAGFTIWDPVLFADGAWYRSVISFDADSAAVSTSVTAVADGAVILDHTAYGPLRFRGADRIFLLPSAGRWPDSYTEGYLRNVSLAVPAGPANPHPQ